MKVLKTVEMDVDAFIKCRNHPLQRDVLVHAKRARKYHLKESHITHTNVVTCTYKGHVYKVDGHTRAYMWERGELKAPARLLVTRYTANNEVEFHQLYRTYDNEYANETKSDQMTGALLYLGLKDYNPSIIANVGIPTACQLLNIATGHSTRAGQLPEQFYTHYFNEIKVYLGQGWVLQYKSRTNSKRKKVPGMCSPVTIAFIVTYRLHGAKCLGFWDNYFSGGDLDANPKAVQHAAKAAVLYMSRMSVNKQTLGRENAVINAVILLNCYLKYNAGKGVKEARKLGYTNMKSPQRNLKELLVKMGFKG